jgi:hypothetical protein
MARYIYKHRRGTTEQWAAARTEIPLEGEIVIELDNENSLHKLKIGDGIHTYAELAYLQAGDEIITQVLAKAKPRIVTVELAETWSQDTDGKYSQTIALDNITAHSRLDLQPDANMLAEFKQLGLVFVTENKGGVITVYSVGNMPLKAYPMQATIVETECKQEAVVGIPVGTPVAQSDWAQTDESKADYIKNKPTLGALAAKSEVAKTDLAPEVQALLDKEPLPAGGEEGQVIVKTATGAEWQNPTSKFNSAVWVGDGAFFDENGYRIGRGDNMTTYGKTTIFYYNYIKGTNEELDFADIITEEKLNMTLLDRLPLDPSNVTIGKIVSSNYDLSGKTIKVKSMFNNYPDWYYGKIYFSDGSYLVTSDDYYCSVSYIDSTGQTNEFYHEYLEINNAFVLPENISITYLTLQYQGQGTETTCNGKEFDSQIGLVLEIS